MAKTLKEIQQDEQFAHESMGININDLPQVIGGSINNYKLLSFLADMHREVKELRQAVDEFKKKLDSHEANKKMHEC